MRDFTEMEFTMPDGSKRFEIVDNRCEQSAASQCSQIARGLKATGFRPVDQGADRQLLELRAASPIRARTGQADMADTPLFGQVTLL